MDAKQKALLDEHLPGWEALAAHELRQRLVAAPGRLRARLRAALDARPAPPPTAPAVSPE